MVFDKQPSLIYVYSPTCPHCVTGAPAFEAAVRQGPKRSYRFNAVPSQEEAIMAQDIFQRVTGIAITHFPMVLGITAKGLLVEYKGPVTHEALRNFYEALRYT